LLQKRLPVASFTWTLAIFTRQEGGRSLTIE
jgi:hypothetical protein